MDEKDDFTFEIMDRDKENELDVEIVELDNVDTSEKIVIASSAKHTTYTTFYTTTQLAQQLTSTLYGA